MKKSIVVLAAMLALTATPAQAGVLSHTETCTEATVTLVGFPARGVHTIYAYGLSTGYPGYLTRSFTGTGATLKFPLSLSPGEYSVLYSWRGSMGGTKPLPYTFVCTA